jgi:drug/metabolite transporter (DMT)-like permease
MAGISWAIIAGVGFGIFQTLNRKAGRGIDAYRGTFILLFISALILTVASLATEDLSVLLVTPLQAFLNFGLAGLIHFFGGWTFLSISQQRVGAARTGAFVGASPLFAALIAALVLGEYIDLLTVAGIVMVVAGVYLVSNG